MSGFLRGEGGGLALFASRERPSRALAADDDDEEEAESSEDESRPLEDAPSKPEDAVGKSGSSTEGTLDFYTSFWDSPPQPLSAVDRGQAALDQRPRQQQQQQQRQGDGAFHVARVGQMRGARLR
eukprot:CAMPEP_0115680438 /NCGR_PEP_ID=MMETSP0272-20121206/56799_1 /TAXON_ID=71861 /ORGANISM="Scrippsiella trochoidea, Strain CCMP3099" /LENGTH=124 /DNA_ID=CAMNT_0003119703 /DNA_START=105 /DNA_END=475 /DNA_ORIENTATION=+